MPTPSSLGVLGLDQDELLDLATLKVAADVTEHSIQHGGTPWGVKASQGKRKEMEDAWNVQMQPACPVAPCSLLAENAEAEPAAPLQPEAQVPLLPEDLAVLSVFDGHGGAEVADHCREMLHKHFAASLSACRSSACGEQARQANPGQGSMTDSTSASNNSATSSNLDIHPYTSSTVTAALRSAFLATDNDLLGTDAGEFVGATAVVAVVGISHIWVAHCGDSRAVIQRGGEPEALTKDHKPDREDESARIKAAGGRIVFTSGSHRVMGMLAMSRAIGDHFLRPYVIAEPEVTCVERTPLDEVLVLATDGLWDVFSCKEATTLAQRCITRSKERGMSRHGACRVAASVLTKVALERGSRDNITVIVVDISTAQHLQHSMHSLSGGEDAGSVVPSGGAQTTGGSSPNPQPHQLQPSPAVATAQQGGVAQPHHLQLPPPVAAAQQPSSGSLQPGTTPQQGVAAQPHQLQPPPPMATAKQGGTTQQPSSGSLQPAETPQQGPAVQQPASSGARQPLPPTQGDHGQGGTGAQEQGGPGGQRQGGQTQLQSQDQQQPQQTSPDGAGQGPGPPHPAPESMPLPLPSLPLAQWEAQNSSSLHSEQAMQSPLPEPGGVQGTGIVGGGHEIMQSIGSFRFAAPPPLNMLPAPGMSANFNGGAVVEVQLSPVNAPASPAPSGQLLQRGGLGGRSVGGGSYAGSLAGPVAALAASGHIRSSSTPPPPPSSVPAAGGASVSRRTTADDQGIAQAAPTRIMTIEDDGGPTGILRGISTASMASAGGTTKAELGASVKGGGSIASAGSSSMHQSYSVSTCTWNKTAGLADRQAAASCLPPSVSSALQLQSDHGFQGDQHVGGLVLPTQTLQTLPQLHQGPPHRLAMGSMSGSVGCLVSSEAGTQATGPNPLLMAIRAERTSQHSSRTASPTAGSLQGKTVVSARPGSASTPLVSQAHAQQGLVHVQQLRQNQPASTGASPRTSLQRAGEGQGEGHSVPGDGGAEGKGGAGSDTGEGAVRAGGSLGGVAAYGPIKPRVRTKIVKRSLAKGEGSAGVLDCVGLRPDPSAPPLSAPQVGCLPDLSAVAGQLELKYGVSLARGDGLGPA